MPQPCVHPPRCSGISELIRCSYSTAQVFWLSSLLVSEIFTEQPEQMLQADRLWGILNRSLAWGGGPA